MQGQLRYHIRLAQDLHDLNVRTQENIKATNILELILVCVDVRGSNHEINSREKRRRDPHPAPHHLVTQNSVEAFPKLWSIRQRRSVISSKMSINGLNNDLAAKNSSADTSGSYPIQLWDKISILNYSDRSFSRPVGASASTRKRRRRRAQPCRAACRCRGGTSQGRARRARTRRRTVAWRRPPPSRPPRIRHRQLGVPPRLGRRPGAPATASEPPDGIAARAWVWGGAHVRRGGRRLAPGGARNQIGAFWGMGVGRTGGVGGAAARVVFERWNAEISIRSNGASKLEFSERQTASRSSFRWCLDDRLDRGRRKAAEGPTGFLDETRRKRNAETKEGDSCAISRGEFLVGQAGAADSWPFCNALPFYLFYYSSSSQILELSNSFQQTMTQKIYSSSHLFLY